MIVLNDSYGTGLAKYVTEAFEAAGGTVVAAPTYNTGDTTFDAQISEVLAADPDAIALITFAEVSTIIPNIVSDFPAEKLYFVDGNLANFGDEFAEGTLTGAKGTLPGLSVDTLGDFTSALDAFLEAEGSAALDEYSYAAESYDAVILLSLAALAAATLASAAQAQEISEFRIGLLGGENASDRMRSNECLREKAEALLGVPTKLFAPADYNGVIEGLLGGNLDMAWLGASGYAKTYLTDPEAVEPVLVKVNNDGSYGYYSIGFARADSGIASLDDMKGKTFGFGDPNSTSGYLIPSIEIPQAGEGITMEPGEYFADVVFTGGHEQTIVAVNNGDIDGGVTWADGQGNWEDGYNSGALRKAVDAGLVDMNELVEIWKSEVIPEGPVVLRTALPADVKEKMTTLVDNLYETDPECTYGVFAGDSLGAKPVTHATYTSIVEARKAEIGG